MAIELKYRDAPNSCRNTARIDDNGSSNINVAPTAKKSTEAILKPFSLKAENFVEFGVNLYTASEANGGPKRSIKRFGRVVRRGEHWTDKHRRHKHQKLVISLAMRPLRVREFIKIPCSITITRYASKNLDKFDNLPMSLKYVLDSICEQITGDLVPGRADSHEGLSVKYDQVISNQYFVKVRIDNL